MQHNAAFHQGLHCLLRLKTNLQGQKHIVIQKFLALTPKSSQWTISYLLYQYVWENPSGYVLIIHAH